MSEQHKPFAWYWYDKLGCLYITGDDRKPDVPADAKPLYEHPAPPPPSSQVTPFSQPRCQCEFPMIKYGGKTVACDHCGLPPGRPPAPEKHVAGRWRVIEAATAPGYWGIEREDAGNDDDAILYPQKIHRDTVARIVEAHNAALATEGSH